MVHLFLRPSKTLCLNIIGLRYQSTFKEKAMRSIVEKIQMDIETNPNIWISSSPVDNPKKSILDPAPGYTIEKEKKLELIQIKYASSSLNGAHEYPFLHINKNQLQDPFIYIQEDMKTLTSTIKQLLGSDHPVLESVARYFFEHDGGKKMRPTMVLLVAKAANHIPMLSNENLSMETIIANQRRLAEITEMIHTASLLHDDVIDEAEVRRGVPSVNKVFGSKLSILAGDFLLARSSIALARLKSLEAVELMSTAIEHLVKGEVMQMRHAETQKEITPLEYYLRKNYYKTASLMANSCKAALVFGNYEERICDLGFSYGRHLGLAFQLIDDILDYDGMESGKPLLADLKAGLSTAPLLLAQEEYPMLRELSARKFEKPGDIDLASELVEKSTGIQQTRKLAYQQAELACEVAMQFPESLAREALIRLAQLVVFRMK